MAALSRILATVGFAFIVIVLPVLEVSPTHVFNPTWPAHARFHEVWQLMTNCAICVVGLWLIWRRDDVRLAAVLGVAIMGGAVAASLLGRLYGGAITYDGGPTMHVLGAHAADIVPLVIVAIFVSAYVLGSRSSR